MPKPRMRCRPHSWSGAWISLAGTAALTLRLSRSSRWRSARPPTYSAAAAGHTSRIDMIRTPETREIGRRNFMKAMAGAPALAALNAAPRTEPLRGGPVRIGFIGVGGQGRALLGNVNPAFGCVVAMADINPASLQKADDVLAGRHQLRAVHY